MCETTGAIKKRPTTPVAPRQEAQDLPTGGFALGSPPLPLRGDNTLWQERGGESLEETGVVARPDTVAAKAALTARDVCGAVVHRRCRRSRKMVVNWS